MSNEPWKIEVGPNTAVQSQTKSGERGTYTVRTQTDCYLHTGKRYPEEFAYRLAEGQEALGIGTHVVDMSSVIGFDEYKRPQLLSSSQWKIASSTVTGQAKSAASKAA